MVVERGKHAGRGREPGVEDIGVDNGGGAGEIGEIVADGGEEGASVEAGRGRAEGEGELPGGAGFEAVEDLGEGGEVRREFVEAGEEEVVGHGTGASGETDGTQADAEVEVENLAPADGDDAGAAVGLDPAEGGEHEERGDLAAAVGFYDGEEADFVDVIVEGEGDGGSVEILVDGERAAIGRGETDEAGDLAGDASDEEDVVVVDRVAEAGGGVDGVLAEFAGIDIVADTGDVLAVWGFGKGEGEAG